MFNSYLNHSNDQIKWCFCCCEIFISFYALRNEINTMCVLKLKANAWQIESVPEEKKNSFTFVASFFSIRDKLYRLNFSSFINHFPGHVFQTGELIELTFHPFRTFSQIQLFISTSFLVLLLLWWRAQFHCFIDFFFRYHNTKECFNDTLFISILQLDTQKTRHKWMKKKIDRNLNKRERGGWVGEYTYLTLDAVSVFYKNPTRNSSN